MQSWSDCKNLVQLHGLNVGTARLAEQSVALQGASKVLVPRYHFAPFSSLSAHLLDFRGSNLPDPQARPLRKRVMNTLDSSSQQMSGRVRSLDYLVRMRRPTEELSVTVLGPVHSFDGDLPSPSN